MTTSRQILNQWDRALFLESQARLARPGCILTARWCSRSADGPLYVLFAFAAWFSADAWWQALARDLLLALMIEVPLYVILKQAFRRPRPAVALPGIKAFIQPADRFSLPSGHTAAAFLVVAVVFGHMGSMALWLLPWALAVGVSRVVLGVHYPGDVLVGAALGFGVGWWVVMGQVG